MISAYFLETFDLWKWRRCVSSHLLELPTKICSPISQNNLFFRNNAEKTRNLAICMQFGVVLRFVLWECNWRLAPTDPIIATRKVRHRTIFAQVISERTYDQLCMCIHQGVQFKIQTRTRWNLTGSNITSAPLVVSPNSVVSSLVVHHALIFVRQN